MEKLIAAKVNRDGSDAEESEMSAFHGVPQHLADKAAFMAEFSSQEVAEYQEEVEEWEAETENAALNPALEAEGERENLEAQFDPATFQFACDNPGCVL